MPDERFALRAQEGRLDVAKIDALHCLGDVHWTGGAPFFGAVPIVDAISRIAVLLDLDQDGPGAERMHSAAGKKNRIAGLQFESVKMLLHLSLFERFLENFPRRSLLHSGVKARLRSRAGH